MPANQFPTKTYTLNDAKGSVPGVDTKSFQILKAKNGEPILAFTKATKSPGTVAPAVEEANFDADGKVSMEAILVPFKLPKGMRRVKSILGDEPQYIDGGATDHDNTTRSGGDDAPREFMLATQVEEPETTRSAVRDGGVEPDQNHLREKKNTRVEEPVLCGLPKGENFRGPVHGKACMRCMMVDPQSREYACFVFEHEKHYDSALKSKVTDWEEDVEIGSRIYMVPALIRDRKSGAYETIWQPFLEDSDREAAHRILQKPQNDYHIDWEKAKEPVPDIGIKMVRSFKLNEC